MENVSPQRGPARTRSFALIGHPADVKQNDCRAARIVSDCRRSPYPIGDSADRSGTRRLDRPHYPIEISMIPPGAHACPQAARAMRWNRPCRDAGTVEDRRCIVTPMPESRVHEIVCRCWPELRAGHFVTVGTLLELGRAAWSDCASAGDRSSGAGRDAHQTKSMKPLRSSIVPFCAYLCVSAGLGGSSVGAASPQTPAVSIRRNPVLIGPASPGDFNRDGITDLVGSSHAPGG
jgi:hypothetical protein